MMYLMLAAVHVRGRCVGVYGTRVLAIICKIFTHTAAHYLCDVCTRIVRRISRVQHLIMRRRCDNAITLLLYANCHNDIAFWQYIEWVYLVICLIVELMCEFYNNWGAMYLRWGWGHFTLSIIYNHRHRERTKIALAISELVLFAVRRLCVEFEIRPARTARSLRAVHPFTSVVFTFTSNFYIHTFFYFKLHSFHSRSPVCDRSHSFVASPQLLAKFCYVVLPTTPSIVSLSKCVSIF